MSFPSTEQIQMRRALFTVCESKEQLARWVRVFIGIDLPDCVVSDESNSSPMDLLWELYDKAHKNDDEGYSRVMAYANRGGGKTLAASIMETLTVLHLGRNTAHMAAIFDQAKKSQEYVRNFFNKPYIRDFRLGQNVKRIEVCRYYCKDNGVNLTTAEWGELDAAQQLKYERIENYIQIVLCTMAGANGAHVEFFVLDELDVIPKQNRPAYEEAKHIPDPRDGLMPISLLTSTRKFSYGLVQKEIREASDSGLHVRHWNAIDITQACAPERHLPNEPKKTYYINDTDIEHISMGDYELLDEQSKKKFYPVEGFAGCATCPIFAACKGRLATHQKSKSAMLKPIASLINTFKTASTSAVNCQVLCRAPDESGLIYTKFAREVHMKTPAQIAEIITGNPYPASTDKDTLLSLAMSRGLNFYGGMDFGFSHDFVFVMGFTFGPYIFVTNVISMPNLELDEKIAICEPLKKFNPTIFGDPEAPADIKTFKRKGFRMKEWDKYKGSVKAGIEVVRMKLQPAVGAPQLFFLRDDPGCELLAKDFMVYHFLTDAAGQISDEPDDTDDDRLDASRYMIMNIVAPKGAVKIPDTPVTAAPSAIMPIPTPNQNIMRDIIKQHLGQTSDDDDDSGDNAPVSKGRFFFST